MSAVKTLAFGVAAWFGLGLVPAQAGSISRSQAERLWTMVWSASAVNSYQGTSTTPSQAATLAPTPTSAPAPTPAPAPAPAAVTPIFAASSSQPTTEDSAPTNAPMIAAPSIQAQSSQSAMATAAAPTAAASGTTPVDAFINMTNGPFPSASTLATGTAQPWYDSPSVIQAFGGVPTAKQQSSFVQTVLQDVQQTFQLSHMNPTLTTDPNTPAQHTISVVSGLYDSSNSSAIGLTNVGGSGLSFIDKLDYAKNPTDLAWAIAHNVSHELMHAFGIGYHPDGGNSVDAASASWSTLTDPNTQFGPQATQLLLASQYGTFSGSTSASGVGAEVLNPDGTKVDGDEVIATPEPATMAMWGFGALGGLLVLRRRMSGAAA